MNEPNIKKQQILNAALDLFSKKGFHGTSLPDIAKKANVSIGVIYYTFKNKEDILLQTIWNLYDVHEQVFESLSDINDPLEQFNTIVRNLYHSMDRSSKLFIVLYKDLTSIDKESREKINGFESESSERIIQVIQKGQKIGRFKGHVDPIIFSFNVIGLGHLWALKKKWFFKDKMTINEYTEQQLRYFQTILLS